MSEENEIKWSIISRSPRPVWPDVAVSGQRGRFRGLGGRQNLVVAGGRCGRLLHLCSNQLPRPGHFLAIFNKKYWWLANLAGFGSAMAGLLKNVWSHWSNCLSKSPKQNIGKADISENSEADIRIKTQEKNFNFRGSDGEKDDDTQNRDWDRKSNRSSSLACVLRKVFLWNSCRFIAIFELHT